MLDYHSILTVVLPVYLVMLGGGLLRRFGVLPREVDQGMMSMVVKVLTPCLILDRVVGNASVMRVGDLLIAAALGFGLVILGIALSYAVAPLIGLKVGSGRRTFAVSCGLQNYGFVAIPIVVALFPPETLGVMFTFTLGIELACWTVGVGLLTGITQAPWKLALNPPVVAILLACLMNFTGLHSLVPTALDTTFAMVGSCAVPIALMLIGAAIADIWGEEPLSWPVALSSPALRLFLIPLAFLAAAKWLPVGMDLKRILLVQGAMPSAVFNIMIARHYGGTASTAVQVVLATTVVSLITTPFVIAWGMEWIGLPAGE